MRRGFSHPRRDLKVAEYMYVNMTRRSPPKEGFDKESQDVILKYNRIPYTDQKRFAKEQERCDDWGELYNKRVSLYQSADL